MRSRTALVLLALVAIVAIVQLVSRDGDGSDNSGSSTTPTTASQPGTSADGARQAPGGEEGAAIAGVLDSIDAGGPYPNRADGEVFQNREGLLAQQPRGYYHSYTVPTPGSADRGARRIITGQGGEFFYTSDHYGSFEPIDAADYQ